MEGIAYFKDPHHLTQGKTHKVVHLYQTFTSQLGYNYMMVCSEMNQFRGSLFSKTAVGDKRKKGKFLNLNGTQFLS